MKIRKLRDKLKNKKFLESKYDQLTKEAEDMNHFREFECSSFFRGYERAEYNRRKYNKEMTRLTRQINFIKKLLKIQ